MYLPGSMWDMATTLGEAQHYFLDVKDGFLKKCHLMEEQKLLEEGRQRPGRKWAISALDQGYGTF